MNIIIAIVFLIYGFVMSYIIANITGKIKNSRNIRLHHWELGFYLMIINFILYSISLMFSIQVLISAFVYLLMLSIGIFLSDIRDIK